MLVVRQISWDEFGAGLEFPLHGAYVNAATSCQGDWAVRDVTERWARSPASAGHR